MRLRFNPSVERWTFDFSIDGNAVLHGRRIVTGIDLLAAFDFGIGAIFAVPTGNASPGRTQLPDGRVKLFHATQEEIDAAMA